MDADIVGKHIREYRAKKNLTQKQLAEKLFVSDRTISRWELGKGLPDIGELPRLARLLGISIDELVGEHISVTSETSPGHGYSRLLVTAVYFVFLAVIIVVLIVSFILAGTFETYESTYIFEAEDAVFSDSFRVEQTEGASGGQIAAWLHTAGTKITFKVNSNRSANVLLGIRVNRAKAFVFENKMQLLVNGEEVDVGVVPGIGFDGSSDELYYKFGEPITVKTNLRKGENIISIVVKDGTDLNIDCIEFTTTAKLTLALKKYVFEAENADIEDGLYSVIDSQNASGNKFVGEIEKGVKLRYSVESDMTAYVMLSIYVNHPYDTDFEKKFTLTINGSDYTVGSKNGTGGSTPEERETNFTDPFTVGVNLKSGHNDIVFTTIDGANFDCISFYTSLALAAD